MANCMAFTTRRGLLSLCPSLKLARLSFSRRELWACIGSICWRGSRSNCRAPSCIKCQFEWKWSSRRLPRKLFNMYMHRSPYTQVNIPVQVKDGGGSVFASSFHCSSTFLRASQETQPHTIPYKAPESSRGIQSCCFAWFDFSSERSASWIAFQASKRSNVDLFK